MALVQQFEPDFELDLAGLAGNDVISGTMRIDAAREQGFRLVESRYFFSVHTKTISQGPVMVGVALGMNAAAVEAAIESDPQQMTSDISRGKGTFIKGLMMIPRQMIGTGDESGLEYGILVNYGKNGWSVPEGNNTIIWATNLGTNAITAGIVRMYAEHFGVWLRD